MAVFGAKDAQQVIAVRALVRDLNIPVEIATVATQRDEDGLARSSRNVFLSAAERTSALALSSAVFAAAAAAEQGASLSDVLAAGRAVLAAEPGVNLDYFVAMNPADASEARGRLPWRRGDRRCCARWRHPTDRQHHHARRPLTGCAEGDQR
ncbi:hypothetical protein GCM10025876_13610 [Demequina litorisediminis]|uniref:pantoate--beta-alanine ligase (AMP-forming) n=1 Tax=Demequina litorisediminis TaxID=1849022 RepID=A0ABQ6IBF9_9MICO|nr:hypothetical protein GCM10025876_13610 [Demequina litorisediminis]